MNNMFDLNGKCALVTGASRGLGRGMAEGLLEAGARCVITGTGDSVFETQDYYRDKGYDITAVKGDFSNLYTVKEIFDKSLDILGDLNILVNNAGITLRHPVTEFPDEDWKKVLDVDLNAPFYLAREAAAYFMSKEGHGGKIINIASMLSFFGGYTVSAYAAAKGGVAQLTKAMCNELAAHGINVNAIAPGYMDTDLNVDITNPANLRYAQITERIPAGRWGLPGDLKGIVVFLASGASDYVNGAVIPVDGGYLVR